MSSARSRWTDERVETIIGNLLRAGVILSALIVVAGGIVFLLRHGGEPAGHKTFAGEPERLRSLGGIVRDALAGHGRGIIELGLLVLIATPVARVAFAVVAFALQRDRLYVAITLVVLSVLVYSLAAGRL